MNDSRTAILGTIRKSLGRGALELARADELARRLARPEPGPLPARAQVSGEAACTQFARYAEAAAATVERVASAAHIPAAVARYLRQHNLPPAMVAGSHPLLGKAPWDKEPALVLRHGRAEPSDTTGIAVAVAGVAETGTLLLASAENSPMTIHMLPETHIVAVEAAHIVGSYEEALALLVDGGAGLPPSVLFVTGPSRSADIEQTLQLGAHGPKRLHILIIGARLEKEAGKEKRDGNG
jgi:L-lactate dehydrogenase complex protein LldG